MANGLDVELDQFKKLKAIDRDVLIYKNIVELKISKLSLTIAYLWLFIITVAIGLKRFIPI